MTISSVINNMSYGFGSVSQKRSENAERDTSRAMALQTTVAADLNESKAASLETVHNSSNKIVDTDTKPEKVVSPKPEVEFSFNLKKGSGFNLIGANSKMEDIDVEKAMSDIKKDSVLDRYKFFVNTTVLDNEDGVVRRISR